MQSPQIQNGKVVLENISFSYNGRPVVQNLNIQVKDKETLAILGPSGCGKTTLLNLIAGFIHPGAGTITHSGAMRTIFQQGSLFPWLTVRENIRMGVRNQPDVSAQHREVDGLLELLHLTPFDKFYPSQLSGGMKQKAELARALAGETEILLMDEPFSSLDYITRSRIRNELVQLLAQRPMTIVLVTHDVDEAVLLANRVIVLSANPMRIAGEVHLHAPRPRNFADAEIVEAKTFIMNLLDIPA